MSKKQVICLNHNECTFIESRVFKQGKSLTKLSFQVKNVAIWSKGLLTFEEIESIPVYRIKLKLKEYLLNTKLFCLIKKYFPFVNILYVLLLIEYVMKIFYSFFQEANILHCYRIRTLPVGIFFKLLSTGNKKVVYDAREYEVEANNVQGIIKKIYSLVERICIKWSDEVICVSDSIANEYVRLYNIKKPHVVLNCPPYIKNIQKEDLFRRKFNLPTDTMIFLYQGGLMEGRGIELMLSAFKKVNDKKKVLIFMGYGPLEDIVKDAANSNDNIHYHEAVSPKELLRYTTSADIGMCLIENICLSYYYCLPNKFFEYMMAELPVICSPLFELKKIVDKYKNGLIVKEDEAKLLSVIDKLTFKDLEQYKQNIPEMKKKYSWEEQEKILTQIYKNIA